MRPRVPHDWHGSRLEAALSALLDELLWVTHSTRPILWFYTPMMYAAGGACRRRCRRL